MPRFIIRKLNIILITLLVLNSCASNKYPSSKIIAVTFDIESKDESMCDLIFPNPETNKELLELKKTYKLKELISTGNSDIEKSLILLNWTNSRWKHDGNNRPEKNDVISILKEAEKGEKFRCVEYGIVLSAALNSIGIPTRTLGIKTKDVETTTYGAGHIVSEAYIPELKKWVFMDGQINYIPFLDGVPLNAVEYKNAIVNHKERIELRNLSGTFDTTEALKKINWVAKYLFYFDVRFDSSEKRVNCNKKSSLMLVPINEKNPTVFQVINKMDHLRYTHNLKDFYQKPTIL
ncbi:transglutaminase-like domain-containing protein [Aquimarina sp. 2201CG14-23]|uniref:transglutaminase-like domain-containing protein n=1 Tax=Aquimarina mycalae TaxID=3040073 RepID=UPI0024781B5E|nr:transglutaminase-like domain-containing protein [Aquimarina sp. 2201CG14-23]MDH7447040.1 transglutaminase-like domain-containing protein [Aquimarina sp. 2201CG14-23]